MKSLVILVFCEHECSFFYLWSVIKWSGNVKINGEDVIFGVQTWNVHTIAILEIIIKMCLSNDVCGLCKISIKCVYERERGLLSYGDTRHYIRASRRKE